MTEPFENDWTREIEKLRKDKAALLTAAKELLMNLYVDGTVANFNARTAKLRAAIARAERGEISTGIFRPRVTSDCPLHGHIGVNGDCPRC